MKKMTCVSIEVVVELLFAGEYHLYLSSFFPYQVRYWTMIVKLALIMSFTTVSIMTTKSEWIIHEGYYAKMLFGLVPFSIYFALHNNMNDTITSWVSHNMGIIFLITYYHWFFYCHPTICLKNDEGPTSRKPEV